MGSGFSFVALLYFHYTIYDLSPIVTTICSQTVEVCKSHIVLHLGTRESLKRVPLGFEPVQQKGSIDQYLYT